jgi:hypothetical protein
VLKVRVVERRAWFSWVFGWGGVEDLMVARAPEIFIS